MTDYAGAVAMLWEPQGAEDGVDGGPVSVELQVEDTTRVGTARRAIATMAHDAGLGEDARGRLALVVTELATNLARHAKDGRLFARVLEDSGRAANAIEVLAVDRGPGIADLGAALADGFSTGGTRGAGLGAVRRVADEFDITSTRGAGTALLVRVRDRERAAPAPAAVAGVVCRPYPGEERCGDGWLVREGERRTTVIIIDGLGHGPAAAMAAARGKRAAEALLDDRPDSAAPAILEAVHGGLRSTRGAAGAVAVVDLDSATLHFAGVGNIAGAIVTAGEQRSLVSHAGILGHQVQKVQAFSHPWPASGILVMHSDGLGTRWRLDQYPGITSRDPALLAAVLFRDFARGRDDATVVVTRAALPRRS